MTRRVVVTGIGSITSIGKNANDLWENAKKGVCGIETITKFDTKDIGVSVSSEVKDFDPKEYLERKEIKRFARFTQLALVATDEAMKMSGINMEEEDPYRVGVIIGTGIGCIETIENEHNKMLERGPTRIAPLFVPKFIPNIGSGNVAIKYGMKGICTTVVTACASGTQSIGDAFRAIKYGNADVMVTGGTESCVTALCIAGFNAITAVSTNSDPKKASRPFDKNRDGFVLGEGAGVLILEELEHAKKRGATILAEVGGYGASCDAYHITSPSPDGDGASKAMELAMEEAGVRKEEISYINAHGTSTGYNDKFETKAIKNLFGDIAYDIPINSTKSLIGHLLGAAGAVEAVICIKSIMDDYIHPTINYETPDEECDLDYVPNQGRAVTINNVLSNSFGFGGHNGTLLFKKYC